MKSDDRLFGASDSKSQNRSEYSVTHADIIQIDIIKFVIA